MTRLNFGFASTLPLILQDEHSECGLACLAMVATYHGFEADLQYMRRNYPISNMGMDLRQLMEIADQINLSARALKVDLKSLSKINLPAIIHWKMEHFVVLHKVTRKGLVIHDPSLGKAILSFDDASKYFTGIVVELSPNDKFYRIKEKKTIGFTDLWSNTLGLKSSLFQIFVFSVALQILNIISPLYIQMVVDESIAPGNIRFLYAVFLGFSLLLLVQVATSVVRDYVILKVSSNLNMQVTTNLFSHLISLSLKYFENRAIGDVISRFNSLNEIRDVLSRSLIVAIVDGLVALVGIILMFLYSAQLTLLVLGFLSVYALYHFVTQTNYKMSLEKKLIHKSRQDSTFIENLRAIQLIKLHQLEPLRKGQWQNGLAGLVNSEIKLSQWDIASGSIRNFLFNFENIVVVCFGALAVINSSMTLGMLFAFLTYKSQFVSAVENLINNLRRIKMLDLHFDRLSDILRSPQEMNCISVAESTTEVSGRITVKELTFKYDGSDTAVFSNISFIVEPGETVAITGPSGCGKSTLVKILFGLLTPSSGVVLFDDLPIVTQISRFRKVASAVMQDDHLLSGTIAENISCFESKFDMLKIVEAAKKAGIHETIHAMPMQYSTIVSDMGNNLSGGQKQKIVLARALYREPKILIMDEATSHLDLASESYVNQCIKNLNITRIIIAHRPETIASADRVIDLISLSKLRDQDIANS